MIARTMSTGRNRMRGVVALTVGLALLALLAVAGLALDLGQLFVAKTEQQNAMDACALSASRELQTPPMSPAQLQRAEAAGKAIGAMNRRLFHKEPILAGEIAVTFSATLNGTYTAAGAAPQNTGFVRCTTRKAGILTWFMHLWGHDSEAVAATAVASVGPSSGNPNNPTMCNVAPLGMCTRVTTPDTCTTGAPDSNGLCIGKWYSGRFSTGGSTTGNFNWLDIDRRGGGANVIAAVLEGTSPVCGVETGVTQYGAETGTMGEGVGVAWNSRFGLYKNGAGNPVPDASPPDLTGYAYTTANYPAGENAYPDYVAKQQPGTFITYGITGNGNPNGIRVGRQYDSTLSGDGPAGHGAIGVQGRRILIMPAVDCSTWGPGHVATISGFVCALMTTPYLGPTDPVSLEYLGTLAAAGTKCTTYGTPGGGGGGSGGPRIPMLVQ